MMSLERTRMKRRRVMIVSCVVILLLVGAWFARIQIDEYRINHVQQRTPRAAVLAALGRPDSELHPVPEDFLYREPQNCGGGKKPATLLLYDRGNFRDSALIYLDDAGRVQCVDRRGIMIIAH